MYHNRKEKIEKLNFENSVILKNVVGLSNHIEELYHLHITRKLY